MKTLIFLISSFYVFGLAHTEKCPGKSNVKLFCYYNKIQSVDNCKCTHVILPVNSDVKSIEKLKQSVNGVKILITVHEFNEGLVELLKNSKVDGFEIDLKKIDSKNDIVDFITTARSKLGEHLTTVVSVPPKGELLAKYYDFKSLSKHADAFILQTAFLGASKNFTFHPSRLSGLWDMQNADSIVDLVTGLGAPLSKLVISAPVQAFQFKLQDEKHTAVGSPALEVRTIPRDELCEKIGNFNWTLERDQDQAGPYIFRNKEWIAFDDDVSIDIKAKYTRIRGLYGLALKDLSQDGGSESCGYTLLDSAYKGLSKKARAPRGAVLHSLEREILDNPVGYTQNNHIYISPYRISRIIDVEGKIHTVRQDTRTEFACSRQGYFVHPRSCNRFYRCVKFDQQSDDFNVFEFDCPSGLAFDERVEVCVWPGSLPNGSACSGSSEIAPVPKERYSCPHEPGYYADPENCRWFFACLDHGNSQMTPYEFRCPFGLVFDQERLVCEWPWLVPKCSSGYEGIYQPSVTVYGGNSLENYDGLGILEPVKLGGVFGRIEGPINKVYSSFGHQNKIGLGQINGDNQKYSSGETGNFGKSLGIENYGQIGNQNLGVQIKGSQGDLENLEGSIGNFGGSGENLNNVNNQEYSSGYSQGQSGKYGKALGVENYGQIVSGHQNVGVQIDLDQAKGTYRPGNVESSIGILRGSQGNLQENLEASIGRVGGSVENLNKESGAQSYVYQSGGVSSGRGSLGDKIILNNQEYSSGYSEGQSGNYGKGLGVENYGQIVSGHQNHGVQIDLDQIEGSQGHLENLEGSIGNFGGSVENLSKESGAQSYVYQSGGVSSERGSLGDKIILNNREYSSGYSEGQSGNYGKAGNFGKSSGVENYGQIVSGHQNLGVKIDLDQGKGTYRPGNVEGPIGILRGSQGNLQENLEASIGRVGGSVENLNKESGGQSYIYQSGGVISGLGSLGDKISLNNQEYSSGKVESSIGILRGSQEDLKGLEENLEGSVGNFGNSGYSEGQTGIFGAQINLDQTKENLENSGRFNLRGSARYNGAKDYNKNFFVSENANEFKSNEGINRGTIKYQPSPLSNDYGAQSYQSNNFNNFGFSSGGFSHGFLANNNENNKNIDIIAGGFSAVKNLDHGVSVSVTPSSIPTVTSVPLPNKVGIYQGGVIANIPQLQIKVHSPNEVIFHRNQSNTIRTDGYISDQLDNKGYHYPKPNIVFEEKPVSNGYYYPKPSVKFEEGHRNGFVGKVDTIESVTPSILIENKPIDVQPHYNIEVEKPVSTYNFQTVHKNDFDKKVDVIQSVTPSILIENKRVEVQPHYNVEVQKPVSGYSYQTFGKTDYNKKVDFVENVTPSILIEDQRKFGIQDNIEVEKPVSTYNSEILHKNDFVQKIDAIQSVTPTILIKNEPFGVQPHYNVEVQKPASGYSYQAFGKTGYNQNVDFVENVTPSILIEDKRKFGIQDNIEVEKPVSTYNSETSHKNDFVQKVDEIQSVTPSILIKNEPIGVQPHYNIEVQKPVSTYNFQTSHKNDFVQKVDAIQSVTPSILIKNEQFGVQPHYNVEVQKPASGYSYQTFGKTDYNQNVDFVENVTPSILIEDQRKFGIQDNIEVEKPISTYNFQTSHKNDFVQKVDAIQSVTPSILIENKGVEVQPHYNVEVQKPASGYSYQTFGKTDYNRNVDFVENVTPSILIEDKRKFGIQDNIEVEKPISTYNFQTSHKNDFVKKVDAIQSVTPSILIENKGVEIQPHYNVEVQKPASGYSYQTFGKTDYNRNVDFVENVTPSILIEDKRKFGIQDNIEVEKPVSTYNFQTSHKNDFVQKVDAIQSVTPSILIENKRVEVQPHYNVEVQKPASGYSYQTFGKTDYNQKVDIVENVTPSILIEDKRKFGTQDNIEVEKPISTYNFQTLHKNDFDQKVDVIQSVTPSILIENKPIGVQPHYNVEVQKPISGYSYQTFGKTDYNKKVDFVENVTPSILIEDKRKFGIQDNIEVEKPISTYNFQTLHKNDFDKKVDVIQSVTPSILIENKPIGVQPHYNVEVQKPVSGYSYQTFGHTDYNKKIHDNFEVQDNVEVEKSTSKPYFKISFGTQIDQNQNREEKRVQPHYNIEVQKPVSGYNFQTFGQTNYNNHKIDTVESVTPSILIEDNRKFKIQENFGVRPQYVEVQKPISTYNIQTLHKNDFVQKVDGIQSVTPSILIENKRVELQPHYNVEVQKPVSGYNYQTFGQTDYNKKIEAVENVTPSILIEDKPKLEIQDNIEVQPQYNFQSLHKNDFVQKVDEVQNVTPSILIENEPFGVQPHYNIEVQKPVSGYSYQSFGQTDYNKKIHDNIEVQDNVEVKKSTSKPYFKISFGTQVDQNQNLYGHEDLSKLEPVSEEPFVKKTAYVTGDQYRGEKLFSTTLKPFYQTVLTTQQPELKKFYIYDSRLSSTTSKPHESSNRIYLPPKIVTTTSKPYLEVTTPYEEVTSPYKKLTTPYIEVTSTPFKQTIIEDYEVTKRPVKVVKIIRPKSKAIVKINDFYPMLSAKLGAQCTCVSNSLNVRKRPEIKYYDYEDDDGFIVDQPIGNDYEKITKKPIRHTTVSQDTPEKTIRVFTSKSEENEPTEKEIKQAVRTGLKLIKSAAKEGAKEGVKEVVKDFDRYGPGGVRSKVETLQGIDCQRAGLFRHPTKCNKFYSCVYDCDKKKFKLHIFNCPVHLTFDNNLGACNWPSQGPACTGDTLLPSE